MFSNAYCRPAYQPKLTAFLMADSHVNEQQPQPSGVSTSPAHLEPHPSCTCYSQITALQARIRYSVQCFIAGVGCEQQMSSKLQFAIENLLLNVLDVARQIRELGDPATPRSSCGVESSEGEAVGSGALGHLGAIRIEDGDDLPVLCECPGDEDECSIDSAYYRRGRYGGSRYKREERPELKDAMHKLMKIANSQASSFSCKSGSDPRSCSLSQPSQSPHSRHAGTHKHNQSSVQLDTELQSQIGAEQQVLSASIFPQFLTKCSHDARPQARNLHSAFSKAGSKHEGPIENSISEYYVEESERQSRGSARDKENKMPVVNEFRVEQQAESKRAASREGSYVYSQVISRRRIF